MDLPLAADLQPKAEDLPQNLSGAPTSPRPLVAEIRILKMK